MNTLRAKLFFGVAVFGMLIAVQAGVIFTLANNSVEQTTEAHYVGVEGALIGNRIKFDVVQVQQWLTDISATRALDGLNDGFEVAAEFADDFELATLELEALRPDLEPDLVELRSTFAIYHATGIEMAEAYIAEGPAGGNIMMGEFDAAAAAMGDTVDALVMQLLGDSNASLDGATDSANQVKRVAVIASLIVTILAVLSTTAIVVSLMRQLKLLTFTASEIASGNLSVDPLPAHDRDSLGILATSFNSMSSSLGAMIGQLKNSSGRLSTAANGLSTIASDVGDSAGKTATQATSASALGADVSTLVSSVSLAVEQMNSSIHEVSVSAREAATVATEAVEIAGRSSLTIGKLSESSDEIDNVVMTIQSIAEQTNLLALNATIEAARAGESGKGFAVVASEVKDLAIQTAQATLEISERIHGLQGDAAEAVEANTLITETIDRINEISTSIASAVEQQSMTTAQIGENVSHAAESSQGIASTITEVAAAANDTRQSIEQTRSAADEMNGMARELDDLVRGYA